MLRIGPQPGKFPWRRFVLLPALLFAKFGDMRGVMFPVPRVEEEQPVHRALAVLRVDEDSCKMLGFQRSPNTIPSSMQRVQQSL